MLAIAIWTVAIAAGAKLERFWPRGILTILAVALFLSMLTLAKSVGNPMLDQQHIWSPTTIAYGYALDTCIAAFFVLSGFVARKAYLRSRRANPTASTGE